jgi:transglutaminase-like putative cysteine protease
LVASLPPVALFSFILVVGTRQGATVNVILFLAAIFTFWSLEANHRLRSWGRWVPVWKGRQDEEPTSITTSLARRMGVACVSAALVLPVFLPTLEDGLVSWRNKTGEGGLGGSGPVIGSGNVDPLVSLVPQLITQTEEELFVVDSTEPSYWRLYTLNKFDGESWTDGSPVTENVGSNGTIPMITPDPNPGRSVTARFTVSGLRSVGMPLVGSPITVTPDSPVQLTVDTITGDLKYEEGVEEGFAYNVISIVPEATFRVLRDTPVGGTSAEIYFETPPLSAEVRELVEEWTDGARTPFQELRLLQDRLRGFNYSLDVDEPMSTDYLEEFLLRTRTGYCQQFATAFAVLARHLGYPARVQVGFLPGSTDLAQPNRYAVNGSDTHAWPEVHFEGLGWVPFEPTPRDGTAPPDYTIRAVPGSVPANPAAADNVFTGGQNKRGFEDIGGVRDNPRGITDGRPDATVPGADRRTRIDGRWVETFTRILIALLVMALAFVASVPMIKRWRIRHRYARATDERARAAAAFAEFQQEAAELASPRKRAESASAYARRIGDSIAPARPAAVRLASIYELAEFGPSELPPQLADEARRLARSLKAKLWAQATWWRRAKRVLSPAGLVRLPEISFRRVALQKLVSLSRS